MDLIRECLAKPSGITLRKHHENVKQEGLNLISSLPATCAKYKEKTELDFGKDLELVCLHHDDGKRFKDWQEACKEDYKNFVCWQEKNKGSYRDYLEKERNKVGQNLRNVKVRHELKSIQFDECKSHLLCRLSLKAAIAAHHRKLCFKYEERWKNKKEKASDLWNLFVKKSNDLIENNNENNKIASIAAEQYQYAGLRGFLQLADHRASAREMEEPVPDIPVFSYKFPYKEKRKIQDLVEKHWEKNLLLLRAPTGAGKTDAALLWASLQIQNKRADRVVIAMPTRFTSNALAISVAESLSNTGLYHSSAWFYKFHSKIKTGEIEKSEAAKIHELARLLQMPVTVCTIDHLLMSLTLTREDHHLITFNLANSCLIIDEADFYDEFVQANILELLRLLSYWKVPVLLMSASLPESSIDLYRSINDSVEEILEDKTNIDRDRFNLVDIREYSVIEDVRDLLNRMIEKGNGIIYANTIEKAILFYKWLKQQYPSISICLYHSRFTEPDKALKEKQILEMLGKEAWKNNKASGIVIMTQIGEMSINISSEIMITELCPIDRLIQRVGRLGRFDEKVGSLYVLVPLKEGDFYPAPYGEYDSSEKKWKPYPTIEDTKRRLEKKIYSSQDLQNLLNCVYPKKNDFTSKAKNNAEQLLKYFCWNWLIVPNCNLKKDDSEMWNWKSRNIENQEDVFVSKTTSLFFENRMDFQEWKLSNSVELPPDLIEKGIRNSLIEISKISIWDETETCYILKEDFYDQEIGVILK